MFHVYWPLLAFITLFIVVSTIIILLRFGPKLCKVRHYTWPDEEQWRGKVYEHKMSYETEA